MLLDDLYGKGSTQALRKALDGTWTQWQADDAVRVQGDWDDGSRIVVDCTQTTARFLGLDVTLPQSGFYTRQCEVWSGFLRARGVKVMLAAARDEKSLAILQRAGFIPGPVDLEHRLPANHRMGAYVAWKRGERGEPKWHKELG